METLSINSDVFARLLADMDISLNMIMRHMLEKGAETGTLTAKIGVELHTGVDKMGREFIEPKFKFKTGINIPMKGSVESVSPAGLILENRSGEFVIVGNQVTMDDVMKDAG